MTSPFAAGLLLVLGAALLGAGVLLLADAAGPGPPDPGCGGQGSAPGALLPDCPDWGLVGGWASSVLGSAIFLAGLTLGLKRHAERHPEEWLRWDDERR